MKRYQHENRCIEFFGKPFTEVHEYLDQFAREVGLANHRGILHNPEGVEKVVKEFGEEARCPALLHLYDDYEYFQHYNREGKKYRTVQELLFMDGLDVVEHMEKYDD